MFYTYVTAEQWLSRRIFFFGLERRPQKLRLSLEWCTINLIGLQGKRCFSWIGLFTLVFFTSLCSLLLISHRSKKIGLRWAHKRQLPAAQQCARQASKAGVSAIRPLLPLLRSPLFSNRFLFSPPPPPLYTSNRGGASKASQGHVWRWAGRMGPDQPQYP